MAIPKTEFLKKQVIQYALKENNFTVNFYTEHVCLCRKRLPTSSSSSAWMKQIENLFWTSLNNFLLFSPQGYERILSKPQRPSALGLQAAGRQGLQHAPHRVKGKKLFVIGVHFCNSLHLSSLRCF